MPPESHVCKRRHRRRFILLLYLMFTRSGEFWFYAIRHLIIRMHVTLVKANDSLSLTFFVSAIYEFFMCAFLAFRAASHTGREAPFVVARWRLISPLSVCTGARCATLKSYTRRVSFFGPFLIFSRLDRHTTALIKLTTGSRRRAPLVSPQN